MTQAGVVWQGTVWDLDDNSETGIKKKVGIHATPWVYNDPTRANGIASGYVFYGITNVTDNQIAASCESRSAAFLPSQEIGTNNTW